MLDMQNQKVDLSGKSFEHFKVITQDKTHITKGGQRITYWICQCECGNIFSTSSQKIRSGHTKSCGCIKHDNSGRPAKDITGMIFGSIVIVRRLNKSEIENPRKQWLGKCECGTVKAYNYNKIVSGNTVSCGCMKKKRLADVTRKHGKTHTKLFHVYQSMKQRCYDPNNSRFCLYGERGISVCEEWLGENGFSNFYQWAIQNGWDDSKDGRTEQSLDRVDNDGNYEPSNCRLANLIVQANNKSTNRYLTYDGKTQTIAEWAREFNIPYERFYHYIYIGYSIEETLKRVNN